MRQDATQSEVVLYEIQIDAPMERVWKALTDPDQLAAWWGTGMSRTFQRAVFGATARDGEHSELRAMVDSIRVIEVGRVLRIHPTGQEFRLESRSGGTFVHLVHSGEVPEGWHGTFDPTDTLWNGFQRTLKFYVEHHPGGFRRTFYRATGGVKPREEAFAEWLAIVDPSGELGELGPGDAFALELEPAEPLEGMVEHRNAGSIGLQVRNLCDAYWISGGGQLNPKVSFVDKALHTWDLEADRFESLRRNLGTWWREHFAER